jgi:N-acyl-D-amino-acid deacylase
LFDLVIEGASVVDGTGNPPFAASVGVRADELWLIREEPASIQARRRLLARGSCVAPGFIDLHSHSGLVLLSQPDHEPKVRQGVTTEVVGVDGISYAPFRSLDHFRNFARMHAGLDGYPPSGLTWLSVADYFATFDRGIGVNVALMIGNSTLRANVLGWEKIPANAAAIREMRALLREAMEEGAFGLSSGLDYVPGGYATTEELTSLAAQAGRMGGIYHTHVRNGLGDRFLDPFREAIEIGKVADAPVHLTHLYRRRGAPGGARRMLDLVEVARRSGQDVTFDTYPYEWSSSSLIRLLPAWIQEGGPDKLRQRLADTAYRARLQSDLDSYVKGLGGDEAWSRIRLGNLASARFRHFDGSSVATVAAAHRCEPTEVICDVLLAEDLGVNQVSPSVDPRTLSMFVEHPHGMIASDSVFLGKRPSPRTYGTFPIVLADVREERRLTLPEAIRKMTSFPAQRLGISDRGLLRDGMKADIVVFDPERINAPATYEDPKQFAIGIELVLVNGQPVFDNGQMTGTRPGRVLRRARDG